MYIVVKAITPPYPVVERSHNERCFQDSDTGEQQPFPRLCEMPSLLLSIVVPAFDEELRCECSDIGRRDQKMVSQVVE